MKDLIGIILGLLLYVIIVLLSLFVSVITIGVANELYLKYFDFKIF
jgi:hypothetical protein